MKKEYCDKLERFIHKFHGDYFYVANHEYYLWVYKERDGKMIAVIHGGEDDTRIWIPFEIKLIKVDEDNTIDIQFDHIEQLESYIKNKLLDDLMVYEI